MGLKKAPRMAIARRRLAMQLAAVGVGLIAVLVPTVALAGGGGHTEKGPGGYPASQFERDDGRIGLVCTDHVYSPGETTTTTQPDQPNPSCRPMTRDELRKEKTNPTKEAPAGDSQTPGAPTTTVTK